MTEKEKMLAGKLYDGRDPELLGRYQEARRLLQELNGPSVVDPEGRPALLRRLFGTIGERTWVESPFMCDYGDNIRLGTDVYVGYNCIFQDDNLITVGDGTLIGAGAILSAPEHPFDPDERMIRDPNSGCLRYTTRTKPVTIGPRCWLGVGVRILPGISVGEGAVIGAGSVVTRDVPPFAVVAGVPAKVLRMLR